ncbi:MAG: Holliday junction branch migration protein RuvA [Gammaproteobacteria bacterium]|nr:MAG: Holliday junction branch migration protein RuvA [Gammaproteobacteria bacterium]TDJ46988.1 MAG: Holliday junction branch migration protein RuvA [Gammaproteobacteria bacterium]
MIGFLNGTLVSKRPPQLTLDVGGVGYEIQAPMSTFYGLPESGEPLRLVTHLVIRDDAHVLYGFASEAERALFRSLLKVSGVGARIALGILSGISVEGFRQCVLDKDVEALTRLPGIGRKTAGRLLVEMPDRLPAEDLSGGDGRDSITNAQGEAHGALLALGYKSAEALRMLKNLDATRLGTEELIREALRQVRNR